MDVLGVVVPIAQIVGNAERADNLFDFRPDVAERGIVHVVPVLVGDNQHIYLGQVIGSIDVSAGERLEHQRGRVFELKYGVNQNPLAA